MLGTKKNELVKLLHKILVSWRAHILEFCYSEGGLIWGGFGVFFVVAGGGGGRVLFGFFFCFYFDLDHLLKLIKA